jgi:hypothetical protein
MEIGSGYLRRARTGNPGAQEVMAGFLPVCNSVQNVKLMRAGGAKAKGERTKDTG